MTVHPICRHCTRNARTVDTPLVKVRVEKVLVLRDPDGLKVIARCHGDRIEVVVDEASDEVSIGKLEVFNG